MAESEQVNISWRDYFRREILSIWLLGFGAGLPYLLVFSTLNTWLRDYGISRSAIGFFSWVGIIYSIKVFWAPIVDQVKLPILHRLGRRKSWVLLAQAGIAISLAALSLLNPVGHLWWVAVLALCVAFSSATQDIALDAWRIEVIDSNYQGLMSAAYVFGYRLALLMAGAGALYIADMASWKVSYQVMACLMLLPFVVMLLQNNDRYPIEPENETFSARMYRSFTQPLGEFFQRLKGHLVVILVFVSVYRLSDITMGAMANPLYLDLGFTLSEIATVVKVFGFVMTMLGAFFCGTWIVKKGLKQPMFVSAILVSLTNILFAVLAQSGHNLPFFALVISADNFSGGMANTALIAFISSLTHREYTATQYALFSSLMTLPGKFISGLSGVSVDHFGYTPFFVGCALLGLPAIILARKAVNIAQAHRGS